MITITDDTVIALTLKELRAKLIEYDRKRGVYPETELQGRDFWVWLNGDQPSMFKPEAYQAWAKECWPPDGKQP